MTETYTVTYDDRTWDRDQRAQMALDAVLQLVERGLVSTDDTVTDVTARGQTNHYDEVELTVE